MIRQEPILFAAVRRSGLLFTLLAGLMGLAISVQSQMVTGRQMEDFDQAFGLTKTNWKLEQIGCSLGANVLWPGEAATFTFHLDLGAAFKGPAKVEVIQYGTKGKAGDLWKPIVFKIAEISSQAIEVDVPAGGGTVTVEPKIGERFGGYAVVFDLGERGRAFGCTCVRVPAAEPGRERLPTYAMDLPWPFEMSPLVYQVFKRLGVKGARVEGGYDTVTDAHFDWAMTNDLTLMLTVGCGNTPRDQQPLGRGRPWLKPNGEMIEGAKEDLAWLPSFDAEFQRYLTRVLGTYGWPKGPINAVELWNEPWEGVSISGWGADLLRYREIYTHMAHAVLESRQTAGVQVLMGGACSSSNTRDKLFCDGQDTFLPWLDFVSIHYQPLAADPALVPQWMNRSGPYGRVQVWDTESWVANSEDRVAAVVASMRAMGQDRTAGIYRGNIYESQKPRVAGQEHAVVQVWSPGAAVAAAQRFIGQRPFRELFFKNGLPWVFLFDGLPKQNGDDRRGPPYPEDGTVVIVGDLGASYERNRTLFRSVAISPEAKLELSDGQGKFILYDFYANPVPSRQGRITIPLDGHGYFLRTDGTPGTWIRLLTALSIARITGIAPVEIAAGDMTRPIPSRPKIKFRVTNVLNRRISGGFGVQAEGLTIEPAEQEIRLNGNESEDVWVEVAEGQSASDNNYRVRATFDAGTNGVSTHAEVLHVNYISHRRITVDGQLEDWRGVIPQTIAQKVGTSLTEKAYLPFRNWDQPSSSAKITAWLAYDERFFYFAARVPSMSDLPRFETRNDDDYFYPDKVVSKGQALTWPAGVRRYSYRKDPDLPSGNGSHNVQIAFNVLGQAEKTWLPFPPGTAPRFCAYQDTDYEFALNQVGAAYGGGTEIFCLARPGAPRKHFYPRQPKAPIDGGPVKGEARLAVKGGVVECALPWSEIPEVKQRLDSGQTIKFSFRVNDGGEAFELAAGRSLSKDNPLTFHNDWATHWANELEFGCEK